MKNVADIEKVRFLHPVLTFSGHKTELDVPKNGTTECSVDDDALIIREKGKPAVIVPIWNVLWLRPRLAEKTAEPRETKK